MSTRIITEFLGNTLNDISVKREEGERNYILFTFDNGVQYEMYHSQDCCEDVYIEDIEGDLNNLIGCPLTMAEEVSEKDLETSESGTWTFYKFATIKGYVTIRWYGGSNGYYSEDVDLVKVEVDEE